MYLSLFKLIIGSFFFSLDSAKCAFIPSTQSKIIPINTTHKRMNGTAESNNQLKLKRIIVGRASASNTYYNSHRVRATTMNGGNGNLKTMLSMSSIEEGDDFDIEIISEDPKCFLIHNMLRAEECEEYISRANNEIQNSKEDNEDSNSKDNSIARSNAPDVSLKISRLWPLPFLCLGAGIPPVLKLFLDDTSSTDSTINLNQVITAVLPNISIAFGITLLLIILITQGMRQYAEKNSRTSKSVSLNQEKDIEFIRTLVNRASSITNHNWYQWEAPVITKYDPGALFASHNDASPTRGSEWAELGGQRVVTVITYLNTCEKGGGTKFDKLNFIVQPNQGSALVFYPSNVETLDADERTMHQSLPAVEDKYIVQLFGRQKKVPNPLGISDAYTR